MSEKRPDLCRWRRNDGSAHETDCGNVFEFTHEGPRENGFNFCPYCGRPLRAPKPTKRGKHE